MSFRSRSSCLCWVFAIVGCSDDGQIGPARQRVGTATSGDVVFAAVVEGDISVYVCGGATTYATHTRWFRDLALADDGGFEATLDGWTITGVAEDDAIAATVVGPADETIELDGRAAREDSIEGLYTQTLDGCATGLVMREEGGELLSQGTWCSDQNEFAQVIVLEPVLTSEGIHVEVTKPSGTTEDFYVEPI